MFLAGTIKYLERTRSLYLASLDIFRDSMLKEPDPGPNYAKLMDDIASKKEANLPTTIILKVEHSGEKSNTSPIAEGERLNDVQVVHYAYHYFKIFKGLIVDLIFSFQERNESRNFFHNLIAEDALRVIEVELNFIYEALYTKVQVVHSKLGYFTRFISFALVVASLSLFYFKVKKSGFDEINVIITYALFLGAIALDTIAFFMLILTQNGSSRGRPTNFDKVRDYVDRVTEKITPGFIGRKYIRFIGKRVSQFLSFINGKATHLIDKVIDCFGLTDFMNEIRYVSHEQLTKELWEFIFTELKIKSKSATDPKDAKKISSARGNWILENDIAKKISSARGFKRHRVPLAPFDSTASQLCHTLPLLNPKHTVIVQESVEAAAKALYVNVMFRNASSVASNAACHLMGNTNKLLETISSFVKLSPYRPFGTYVFCTGNGRLVVVRNPDAVLEILFYSSQLSSGEGSEISIRSVKDHCGYQSEIHSLETKTLADLDQLEELPLSSNGGGGPGGAGSSGIDIVLNELGLGFLRQKLTGQGLAFILAGGSDMHLLADLST
ncbi:hypothetical protein LWI29_003719 [Acer saccharum]|uniref:DUF4220 domain-containing protein n=1 Tax=Acer saccharum TaxID=4024 RepID=A0AA39W1W7_ACESA|nr:hypothetical protein LWI29_003719 [Acer saccharum]